VWIREIRVSVFQLVGLCVEIHRELGKGHDEVIYKDDLVVELSPRWNSVFAREKLRKEETRIARIITNA
jgi:hypothetical protein